MGFSLEGAGKGATTGASAGSAAGGWGAAIGAIGGALVGGFMGNKGAKDSGAQQFAYNMKLQKQAQKWQEYMSNTAHQREKIDLLESGINPLFTATGGNGASTGSVGASSVNNDGRAQAIQQAISNALNFQLMKKEIEKLDTEIDNINGSPKTIIGKFLNGKAGEIKAKIGKSIRHVKSSANHVKESGKNIIKGHIEKNNFIDRMRDINEKNAFYDEKGRRLIDIDKQIRKKYKAY